MRAKHITTLNLAQLRQDKLFSIVQLGSLVVGTSRKDIFNFRFKTKGLDFYIVDYKLEV